MKTPGPKPELRWRNVRRVLPFAITAVVSVVASALFTSWVYGQANESALRLTIMEQSHRMEEEAKLSDRLDKVMFTKSGDFRFHDLTNMPGIVVRDGKKTTQTIVDYVPTDLERALAAGGNKLPR